MNYANHDHYLICELSKDLPVYEIAEKFEMSQYMIKKILISYGIEPAAKKRKSKADQIYEMILNGMSNEEIVDIVGGDLSYVRQVKMTHGIKTGRKKPDVTLYKKQCSKVDRYRSHGMTTKDACASVGITYSKYKMYRDNVSADDKEVKRVRGKSKLNNATLKDLQNAPM